MRKTILLSAAGFALFATAAWTQSTTSPAAVLTRMSSAYRVLQSYQDTATIKDKRGKREVAGALTLAMQKPNRYLLDLKGENLGTVISSDGVSLVAIRPDRKAFTKTRAPLQLIGSNLIGTVDIPSPGAVIISQFLAATSREGAVGKMLSGAKVTGPQPLGSKLAYVLSFPWTDELEARLYVTDGEFLIRQVKLLRDGELVWQEDHNEIALDKPIAANVFSRPIPENYRVVLSLPSLEKPESIAADEADKDDAGGAKGDAAARILRVRSVYRTNGCARCHVINGRGGQMGPDLTHAGADEARDAKWFSDQVRNPRLHNASSSMPAFGGKIRESDLLAIGTYLSNLK